MEEIKFDIDGLLLFKPRIFEDDRGYFFESFNQLRYKDFIGGNFEFVQDNISRSNRNVVRGLHFQSPPKAQGKLVSVLRGAVLDIAVDIRKGSPTYGNYHMVELSEHNKYQFWIPPGFAHGFVSLEDDTIFSYKCTDYYSAPQERTLLWNDELLGIDWGVSNPILSPKDLIGESFEVFESPFEFGI